jgi:hypothetical protein
MEAEQPEAYPPRLFETPDEPVQELTPEQEELQKKRDKAQKCKVIVLKEMGFHPITTNTNTFNKLQKRILLEKVQLLFDEGIDKEITDKFNYITEEILMSKEKEDDYTNFPVYRRSI